MMELPKSLADAHRICAQCIRQALERDECAPEGHKTLGPRSRTQLKKSLVVHDAEARKTT